MRYTYFLVFQFLITVAAAQHPAYTTANAHSHNDYEQNSPFSAATAHQFGSIEADIFLSEDTASLFVAHTRSESVKRRRTLDSLYLLPLQEMIRKNNGSVYPDSTRRLQLMIDVKTAAEPTLRKLIMVLQRYPPLLNCPSLRLVISGNRPDASAFSRYPPYIFFDGLLEKDYPAEALPKIAMLSAPFYQYSSWKGDNALTAADSLKIGKAVQSARRLGKPVRLWAAPDEPNAWKTLMRLQVGYINTDHIDELSDFLQGATGLRPVQHISELCSIQLVPVGKNKH